MSNPANAAAAQRTSIGFSDSDENWLATNRRRIQATTSNAKLPPALLGREDFYRQPNHSTHRTTASSSTYQKNATTASTRRRPATYKSTSDGTYDSDSYDSYDSYDSFTDSDETEPTTTRRALPLAATIAAPAAERQRPKSASSSKLRPPPPVAWSVDTSGFRSSIVSSVRSPRSDTSLRSKQASPVPANTTAQMASALFQTARRDTTSPVDERPEFMRVQSPRAGGNVSTNNIAADLEHREPPPHRYHHHRDVARVDDLGAAHHTSDAAVHQLAQALTALLAKTANAGVPTTPTPVAGAGASVASPSAIRRRVVTVNTSTAPAVTAASPSSTLPKQHRSTEGALPISTKEQQGFFTYVVPAASPRRSSKSKSVVRDDSEALSPNAPRLAHVDTLPLSPVEVESGGNRSLKSPSVGRSTALSDGGEEILGGRTPPTATGRDGKGAEPLDLGDVARYERKNIPSEPPTAPPAATGGQWWYILTETQLDAMVQAAGSGHAHRVTFKPRELSDAAALRSHFGVQLKSDQLIRPPQAMAADGRAAESTRTPQRALSIVRVSPPPSRPPSLHALRSTATPPPPPSRQQGSPSHPWDAAPAVQPQASGTQRFFIPRLASSTPPRNGSPAPLHAPPPPTSRGGLVPAPQPVLVYAGTTNASAPHEVPYPNIPVVMSLESSMVSVHSPIPTGSSGGGGRQLSAPRTRRASSPAPPLMLPGSMRRVAAASPVPVRHATPTGALKQQDGIGIGSGGESLSPRRPFSPPKTRPHVKATQNIFHSQ